MKINSRGRETSPDEGNAREDEVGNHDKRDKVEVLTNLLAVDLRNHTTGREQGKAVILDVLLRRVYRRIELAPDLRPTPRANDIRLPRRCVLPPLKRPGFFFKGGGRGR